MSQIMRLMLWRPLWLAEGGDHCCRGVATTSVETVAPSLAPLKITIPVIIISFDLRFTIVVPRLLSIIRYCPTHQQACGLHAEFSRDDMGMLFDQLFLIEMTLCQ
jgi:hypothetical protein